MEAKPAIEKVLREAAPLPMTSTEITRKIQEKGLWKPRENNGPEYKAEKTINGCLNTGIRRELEKGEYCPWEGVGRKKSGVFVLKKEARRANTREGSQTGRGTGRARPDPEQQTLPPEAADEKPFDPKNERDACERIEQTIVQRRGQQGFRESLILAYEGKCAITGCSIRDVLEAAHIVPYRDAHTNNISNGLLLRADLHTLFDCKLLAIDPATMEVLLAPDIRDGEYKKWCGRRIQRPKTPTVRPNTEALRMHLEACRNAWRKRRSIEVTR